MMNASEEAGQVEDAGLWHRVLADEPAAFEEVVTKYQNLVAAVAYSATGDFELSEEVTQETFWQAWRQRFQLRDHDRLAAWLCGIGRNLALQQSRREGRHATAPLDDGLPAPAMDPVLQAISTEEREIVWATLAEIPVANREALVLFYREGQSMAEVATALGVSTDVAKQRVHRGRELLRATLAQRVEEVLVRSRPSRVLTARVMVGLAALTASLKATASASAASVGGAAVAEVTKSAAITAAGGVASTAMKSVATTGAAAGLMGGLLGAAGGLGAAFLGCWLPAQMAETIVERDLLLKHGRLSFRAAVVFTLALLGLTPLLLVGWSVGYFTLLVSITVIFLIAMINMGLNANQELKQLHQQLPVDAELNPSPLRRQMGLNKTIYRGRCYTSQWKWLGVPLVDIQFNDAIPPTKQPATAARRAFGWIALGDHATGLLFAAGGIAKGLVAVGGLAIGGLAFGGGAIGGVAIGGGALGWLAFGGGAIGYEAVGGLAIAWHVATGGGAVAYHLAVGGGAWAHDFAVGGGAWAAEVNTEAAKALAKSQSKIGMMEWLVKNQLLFIILTLIVSFAPAWLMRYAYQPESRELSADSKH
jgi:RNA polymerase sigma factor (sigma-70 family)